MPAIPYPKLEDTPAEYQAMVAANPRLFINILSMWANAPATIKLVCLWGQAQFTQLELSPSDRELVILLTGTSFESAYELAQHVPMGLAAGCSEAQVQAILNNGRTRGYLETSEAAQTFSEKELVLLRWIRQVALTPEVPEAMMESVKSHYSPREITEALTLHGWYYMVGRLTTVLKIDVDDVGGLEVLAAFSGIAKQ
ncbi:hypothetical protein RQP46_007611 [Phenoliferia psychrophenolica]